MFCRVYYHNDFDADLSAILVLSQYTETLLTAVDEHFRQVFLKQAGEMLNMELNPYFLLAWVVSNYIVFDLMLLFVVIVRMCLKA